MELKFNEAKTVRPNHLERCLCYDKFLKGYRCYVYDDISKYWCTQATTEHDPNGDNHIVDYADYQVTKWASLSNIECPPLLSNLDEAAKEYTYDLQLPEIPSHILVNAFKAGAEWMAGQGVNADFEVRKLANMAWLTPNDEKKFAQDVFDNFPAGDKVVVQIRKK